MAFQNLAAPGVMDLGAISIGDVRSKITQHAETGIFEAHGAVIFRPFLSENGIFETCFFKSRLPVVDSLDQVRTPFFRGGGIYIVNDGLYGFHQFSPLPFFHVFGPGFQFPAYDEIGLLHLLLFIRIHHIIIREITHPAVYQPLLIGDLGQQQEGGVDLHGYGAGRIGSGEGRGGWERRRHTERGCC